MKRLLFGTAGVPLSSPASSTQAGIERIADLGLGCMEMEFVRGVRMSPQNAVLASEVAAKKGVSLTAHGPYFINLNAREPEKVRASQERILQTARIAAICGAESITFHAAFYLSDPPRPVYEIVKKRLGEIMEQLRVENNQVWVRPELTGKASQFGTLEELLDLSAELEGVAPCIDFAHLHARTGRFNSYEEFSSTLEQIKGRLGREALDNMHIHISGIAYGKHGEIRHLILKQSDLHYAELIKSLKDYDVKGLVICESPNLEDDALLLQQTYEPVA